MGRKLLIIVCVIGLLLNAAAAWLQVTHLYNGIDTHESAMFLVCDVVCFFVLMNCLKDAKNSE